MVPQASGADEFLRVTRHEQRRVVVFSHWGDHCVAATPVRVSDLAELAELIVAGLARSDATPAVWDPPSPDDVVALGSPIERSA
jgi:hypothetical protein